MAESSELEVAPRNKFTLVVTDQPGQDGNPREVEACSDTLPKLGDLVDGEDGKTRTVTDVRYRMRRRGGSSGPSHVLTLVVTLGPTA